MTKNPDSSRWPQATLALFLFLSIGSLTGCGDDDGTTSAGTSEEQIQESLEGLAGFGATTLSNTEMQVMSHAAIASLMSGVGLDFPDLGDVGGLGAPLMTHDVDRFVRGNVNILRGVGQAQLARALLFGTYVRDIEDNTQPFPGWVLQTPNIPADGLIFRFDADPDDITVVDGSQVVPVAGEVRFLGITIDQTGPETPADDIVTSMTHELALGTDLLSLTTVARIAFDVTLDAQREPASVMIGDEADLASTFIGPLSFALSFAATNDDLDLSVRLGDLSTNPAYVLRLALSIEDLDAETGNPAVLDFTFAYGETNDPTDIPWEIDTRLDNFQVDATSPGDVTADVNGTIAFHDLVLATYSGDTSTVFFDHDLNGDGVVDDYDSCVNVNITFTESGRTQSICEAFQNFGDLALPTGAVSSLVTHPTSPLLWMTR